MEQQGTTAGKIVVHALYAFKAQNTDEVIKHGFVDDRKRIEEMCCDLFRWLHSVNKHRYTGAIKGTRP